MNGVVDPETALPGLGDFLYQNGLLDSKGHGLVNQYLGRLVQAMVAGDWRRSALVRNVLLTRNTFTYCQSRSYVP